MPYRSEAQRRYMHAKVPKVASRWDKKYGGKVKKKKKRKVRRRYPVRGH